jgi:hypothetical protein
MGISLFTHKLADFQSIKTPINHKVRFGTAGNFTWPGTDSKQVIRWPKLKSITRIIPIQKGFIKILYSHLMAKYLKNFRKSEKNFGILASTRVAIMRSYVGHVVGEYTTR